MLKHSLAKLVSAVLASFASAGVASIAVTAIAPPVAAQEVAQLAIADISDVSAAELEAAVTTLVQQLRAAGYTDLEIAAIVGAQLEDLADDLPVEQQRALIGNVVSMLATLSPTTTVAAVETQVLAGYGPIDGPVALAEEAAPSLLATY